MGEQSSEGKTINFAIIEGIPIELPWDAKFIVQDKRGCWFYASRRPRIKEEDWTPKKHPIQIFTAQGHQRVLQTDVVNSWENSLQMIVTKNNLPTAHGESFCGNQLSS